MRVGRGLSLASLVLACGCRVGPTYRRPSAPVPTTFLENGSARYAALPPGTWRPAMPRDATLKGRWWTIFESDELDALETALDRDNQSVAIAFENFMAARAAVDIARAGYFPTVTVGASGSRTGTAGGSTSGGIVAAPTVGGAGAPVPTTVGGAGGAGGGSSSGRTFFSVPATVSWAPDLWGRVANAVRASRYAAQVSAADLVNVRLTQEAALATFYFELRGQDALVAVYERTLRADRESLELTRAQFETGIGLEEAVAQAEVTLANATAAATAIRQSRAIYEHAIATLIGRPASSFTLAPRLEALSPPAIPVGVPSDLLERRPDIAAAERTLAQANAQIGVAEAAYYPSLTLSASGALTSSGLDTLVSAPMFLWSLGASASETVFEGGLRRATVAQYSAIYRANVAAYRQTVLTAFQQIEDQLASLRGLSQQIVEQERASNAARRYLELARSRFETGIGTYLDVIVAQSLLLGAEQSLVASHVSSMTAAVSLIQGLGGGWNVAELPPADEVTSDKALDELRRQK